MIAIHELKMSKQSTLFKAWGGRKEPSCNQTSTTNLPSTSHSLAANPAEDYEIPDDDNFDNFFDDALSDELDLIQSYGGDLAESAVAGESTHFHPQPSTYSSSCAAGGASTSSDLQQNLHQKTLAFHVGPSHSLLNSSMIEEDIPGFDPEAGELWIYPTNYPLRDYQFNIVQKALFTNTLVCLPTGLGKTFIAAVVMYNFYRWYPNCKIVFLAPTKPLVTQQIEACYGVVGIPQEHAAEMTGNLPPKERVGLWKSRRVFFLTPQVMQNDVSRGLCPAQDVCCVVFDEAHKALGNYAYCQVVKELTKVEGRFRVLALSATPGNDLKAVQQVVTNLQISNIELRNEDSFDIQRYVHERKVEKIIVPLEGEIAEVKNNFIKVLSSVVTRLSRYGVIYHSNTERMSKYQLLHARDQFRLNGCPAGVSAGAVESDFALGISLYHAYELLLQHGMRSFHQFLTTTFTEGSQQSRAKMEVLRSPEFIDILNLLDNRLGHGDGGVDGVDGGGVVRRKKNKVPSTRFCITGAPQVSSHQSFFYSHPKLNKLEEVVLEHFRKFEKQAPIDLTGGSSKKAAVNTRVMIFSQYRESVQEISELLTQHSPLIRVMTFVGHGSGKSTSKGLTQKEQTEIVRKFREGGYNTLVATCVGEEGLDIGEVDLIVCFDAAKSPIRLVQRMGRTGRKRDGRIVVIVAEGKEDQIYNKSQSNKKSIHRAIKEGCRNLVFFKQCPRMVPRYISPKVHKMHMTIGEFVSSKPGKRGASAKAAGKCLSSAGQSKLGFGASKFKKGNKHGFLSNDELSSWSNELALSDREFRTLEKSVEHCFPTQTEFLSVAKLSGGGASKLLKNSFVDLNTSFANTSLNSSASQMRKRFYLSLSRWAVCQTAPIPTAMVGHSNKTQQLTSTLEFIDLLNSTDGVGQSYDLEMETFLNQEDVLKSTDGSCGEEDGTVQKKKKVGSVRRFLDESSDEETFQNKKINTEDKEESCDHTADSAINEATVNSVSDQIRTDGRSESDEVTCDVHERDTSSDKEQELTTLMTGYTASQHVIPRAPSLDSLDWLDEVDPSQAPTSLSNKEKDCFKMSATSSESASKKDDFQFVTPKAPPSSRRSKIQASSTPISSECTRKKSPFDNKLLQDSIDVFDDLSANAIFDDFSDTSLLSSSKHEMNEVKDFIDESKLGSTKSAATKDERRLMSIRETSKRMEDYVVIDSDSDEEEKESEGEMHARSRSLMGAKESSFSSDDSFLLAHDQRRKRAFKAINHLLESPSTPPSLEKTAAPTTASVSPSSKENATTLVKNTSGEWLNTRRVRNKIPKKVTRFDLSDSSDDEFDVPLMQRIGRKASVYSKRLATSDSTSSKSESPDLAKKARRVKPRKRKLLDGFVDEEAEVSSDERGESRDHEESSRLVHDYDDYDMEDSFINDNSMLTQVSPSQRERVRSKRQKSDASGTGNMYLQSLMSPEDHLFGGRKKRNNQFRMVLSQRHQILNHYINKAGFNIADSARKESRHKRRKKMSDSDREDSQSEAEEVNFLYGEEDRVELSQSQSLTDVAEHSTSRTSSCVSSDCKVVEEKWTPVVPTRKRRPGFLSDSDHDASLPLGDKVVSTSASKRLKLSKSSSPKEREGDGIPTSSSVDVPPVDHTASSSRTINRVVVSPSLLARITIKKTPPCFSLGMDDWLSVIDDLLSDSDKGEPPSCGSNHNMLEAELGVASEGLLLSQEEMYQLDEGFEDSDTELL